MGAMDRGPPSMQRGTSEDASGAAAMWWAGSLGVTALTQAVCNVLSVMQNIISCISRERRGARLWETRTRGQDSAPIAPRLSP